MVIYSWNCLGNDIGILQSDTLLLTLLVHSLALGTLVNQCWYDLPMLDVWLTNVEPWLTNIGYQHWLFFIFLQIFAIFDDFSIGIVFFITFGTIHFEKSSNMAKIWGKMKKTNVG